VVVVVEEEVKVKVEVEVLGMNLKEISPVRRHELDVVVVAFNRPTCCLDIFFLDKYMNTRMRGARCCLFAIEHDCLKHDCLGVLSFCVTDIDSRRLVKVKRVGGRISKGGRRAEC
jgi:hypothetical protein